MNFSKLLTLTNIAQFKIILTNIQTKIEYIINEIRRTFTNVNVTVHYFSLENLNTTKKSLITEYFSKVQINLGWFIFQSLKK